MSPEDTSTSDSLPTQATQASQRRVELAAMHGSYMGRLGRTERLVELRIKTLVRRYQVLLEMELLARQRKAQKDGQARFDFENVPNETTHVPPASFIARIGSTIIAYVHIILHFAFRFGRDPGR